MTEKKLMKKLFISFLLGSLALLILPINSLAAGGVYASGGGNVTVGQTFTVNVTASGATFDTVHGTINVSGPVSVVSFSAGDATWLNKPSNGGTFDGAFLGQKKTSFTIATIKLKANSVGSGAVSVSNASLKNAGSVVGSGSGNASYTIAKAPELPGAVKVSSSSHPDQNTAYEATTIALEWNKESGVDGFSYLLDQAEKTTPAAKATDANTSVTYADKAIGTYYFHIRAHKPDGWGGATHFKINIKEPDAKINESLSKPSNIKIEKTADFVNNIKDGLVTGIKISGTSEPGFTINATLTPVLTIPEGKKTSAITDESGNFEIILDFPIAAGFHKLTLQGQKEKVLTPVSEEITFEISQKQGGIINILTAQDEQQPQAEVKAAQEDTPSKTKNKVNTNLIFYGIILIFLVALAVVSFIYYQKKKTEANDIQSIMSKAKIKTKR